MLFFIVSEMANVLLTTVLFELLLTSNFDLVETFYLFFVSKYICAKRYNIRAVTYKWITKFLKSFLQLEDIFEKLYLRFIIRIMMFLDIIFELIESNRIFKFINEVRFRDLPPAIFVGYYHFPWIQLPHKRLWYCHLVIHYCGPAWFLKIFDWSSAL